MQTIKSMTGIVSIIDDAVRTRGTPTQLQTLTSAHEALSFAMRARIKDDPRLKTDPMRRLDVLRTATNLTRTDKGALAAKVLHDYEIQHADIRKRFNDSTTVSADCMRDAICAYLKISHELGLEEAETLNSLLETIDEQPRPAKTALDLALWTMCDSMKSSSSNEWPLLEAMRLNEHTDTYAYALKNLDDEYAAALDTTLKTNDDKLLRIAHEKMYDTMLLGRMLVEVIPLQDRLIRLHHEDITKVDTEVHGLIDAKESGSSERQAAKNIWLACLSAEDDFSDRLKTSIARNN